MLHQPLIIPTEQRTLFLTSCIPALALNFSYNIIFVLYVFIVNMFCVCIRDFVLLMTLLLFVPFIYLRFCKNSIIELIELQSFEIN